MKKYIFLSFLLIITSLTFGQKEDSTLFKSLFEEGRYQEIVERANKKLASENLNDSIIERFLVRRAYAYDYLRDYENAKKDWLVLVEKHPDDVDYYNSLAYSYWQLYDTKSALSEVMKAYKINSNDVTTLSNLAYYFSELGLAEEGIKYANIGLSKKNLTDRQKGLLHSNKAFGEIGLGKYKKAAQDASKSIKFHPENSFPYYYRALANVKRGKMKTVCSDLNTSKSLGAIYMTKELLDKYCEN